jgi:hypothetical protein
MSETIPTRSCRWRGDSATITEVPVEPITNLSARERLLLRLALLWPDVVYDPTRSDNEERSAEGARRAVLEHLRSGKPLFPAPRFADRNESRQEKI